MSELPDRLTIAAFTPALHEMSTGYHRHHVGKADMTSKVIRSGVAAVLRELATNADRVEMALSWDLYLWDLADEIEAQS